MNITAISDFHGILPEINSTDILLICGDISPFNIDDKLLSMESWVTYEFKAWIKNLNCDKVILIPGNHDFYLESLKTKKQRREFEELFLGKLKCLWNEYYEYIYEENNQSKILKIFGTPYCHLYGNWAFMRTKKVLIEKFKQIPPNLDILLTHDPIFSLGNTDVILNPVYDSQIHCNHVGNEELREQLIYLNDNFKGLPKYCISGHIHSGEHSIGNYLGMKYANVSLMDESCNKLVYSPLNFNLEMELDNKS
jgi:Icc-related predicted phosphoesterase